MKKFNLLLFLLLSSYIFACKCISPGFGESFAENDFIAEIEILKTYNINLNKEYSDRFYKADIRILKLYKGKPLSSIVVSGRVEEAFGPACEIKVTKGDKFLVYLSKEGNFEMSSCTPKRFLNDKKIDTERKALTFLIDKKIKRTNASYQTDESFRKFRNMKPENDFAVYRIKVNSKSKAESVSVIQNFGIPNDHEILSIIKNEFVFSRGVFQELKNEKVWLVLFFDNNNENILSTGL